LLSSKTYWNAVVQLADEQGVDVSLLVQGMSGVEHSRYVPFGELKALVEKVSEDASLPWMGLTLGPRLAISSHGSVGYALSTCKDLEACLQLVSQYDQTRFQFMSIEGEQGADSLSLSVTEKCDWEPVRQILQEAIVIGILNVIAYIVGDKVGQCKVYLPYPEPQWSKRYQAIHDCDYIFDADDCRIVLPLALLSVPSISFDAQSLMRAREQCEQELRALQNKHTLSEAVREWIEEGERYSLNIDQLAAHFNLSVSTLIRKLRQEKTSYKIIMEELKKSRASRLLQETAYSVEAIACIVGYSDVSNFNRSFKRWFGSSPAVYREQFREQVRK
jgi:AraC-like DNA-binding protein